MNLILTILAMVVLTWISATGSLFLKKGASILKLTFKGIIRNFTLLGGLCMHLFSSIFFILLLKTSNLSFLYPFSALSYIWVALLSIKYLKEKLNFYKWIGIGLIIIGACLLSLHL